MADPVLLLGKSLPITVAPGVDDATVAKVLPVIQNAVDVLNGQQDRLTDVMQKYIGALQGFGISLDRSFTPLPTTADAADGVYVYFFGAADVAINVNPRWYASTIIHDGGHASLSQEGKVAIGVQVEQELVGVQIDYYAAVGDPDNFTANLQNYENDTLAIQHRINQPVDGPASPTANA
jgi:hypothetical protein